MQLKSNSFSPSAGSEALPQPGFRSGSVARKAGMPVSTLRIWEQRYQAVAPVTTPTGHRLYSSADVERVVLLRQLTEQGHAIGSLAGLDMNQLSAVAASHAGTDASAHAASAQHGAPMRIAVVGQAMALRLKRPAVCRHWPSRPQLVAVFDSLADALAAPATSSPVPIDLLLWHTAGLHDGAADELTALQAAWRPRGVAVAYRFAGSAARDALAQTGAAVVREPADDDALTAWLGALQATLMKEADGHAQGAGPVGADAAGAAFPDGWPTLALGQPGRALPPRRFDDASLTAFAGRSSGIACDCPSHVAELLMQLAAFESYSAECAHRSAADAELHAYLQQVAGTARLLFESALERVAIAEGFALP